MLARNQSLLRLLLLLSLVLPALPAKAIRFLALSDIHYNPFDAASYNPGLVGDEADPNAFFLQNLLQAIAAKASEGPEAKLARPPVAIDFILITGDLLVHRFPALYEKNKRLIDCGQDRLSCALETMDKAVAMVRASGAGRYACTPIYLSLGNNDAAAGNYTTDLSDLAAYGRHFYKYSHPCTASPEQAERFAKTFAKQAGAYTQQGLVKGTPYNLLVLNTVFYAKREPRCQDKGRFLDCAELRERQNQLIRKQLVNQSDIDIVMMHIPLLEQSQGYDTTAQPAIEARLLSSKNTYFIAGHAHQHYRLSQLPGQVLSPLTYRLGVQPGFSLFDLQQAQVKEVQHCWVQSPFSLRNSEESPRLDCAFPK